MFDQWMVRVGVLGIVLFLWALIGLFAVEAHKTYRVATCECASGVTQ